MTDFKLIEHIEKRCVCSFASHVGIVPVSVVRFGGKGIRKTYISLVPTWIEDPLLKLIRLPKLQCDWHYSVALALVEGLCVV